MVEDFICFSWWVGNDILKRWRIQIVLMSEGMKGDERKKESKSHNLDLLYCYICF